MPRLDETVATPEEWETDPFGTAMSIVREACTIALSYEGAMSNDEFAVLLQMKGISES